MSALLEASIRASGLSEREIERRLRWRKGSLRCMLQNGAGVAHRQALEILGALSAAADPELLAGSAVPVGNLLDRFQRLGYDLEPEPIAGTQSGSDVESGVEEVLREAFGADLERGREEDEE